MPGSKGIGKEQRKDTSIWRSLAVAFGDGVAFGIGMKISQSAGRRLLAAPVAVPIPLAPPARIGDVDRPVLEALTNALESRLHEHEAQVERCVTELQTRISQELQILDQQDRSIADHVSADIHSLESRIVELHREFGEAVARIVAEQVASQVEARVDAQVETRVAALQGLLESRIHTAVAAALEPQLTEISSRQELELAQLRHQVSGLNSTVMDFVQGIGKVLHRASKDAPATAVPPLTTVANAAETGRPAAAAARSPKASKLWRVPRASSTRP